MNIFLGTTFRCGIVRSQSTIGDEPMSHIVYTFSPQIPSNRSDNQHDVVVLLEQRSMGVNNRRSEPESLRYLEAQSMEWKGE
jgi:hypothetical protein